MELKKIATINFRHPNEDNKRFLKMFEDNGFHVQSADAFTHRVYAEGQEVEEDARN